LSQSTRRAKRRVRMMAGEVEGRTTVTASVREMTETGSTETEEIEIEETEVTEIEAIEETEVTEIEETEATETEVTEIEVIEATETEVTKIATIDTAETSENGTEEEIETEKETEVTEIEVTEIEVIGATETEIETEIEITEIVEIIKAAGTEATREVESMYFHCGLVFTLLVTLRQEKRRGPILSFLPPPLVEVEHLLTENSYLTPTAMLLEKTLAEDLRTRLIPPWVLLRL
jgi:hypothetical protein